ncbi:MAG: GNAT family N-acetyltransferase [Alphaproteobacteria bacterium]
MTIRLATQADLPAIRAVARAAYAIYVERMGREPAPMVADFASQIGEGQVHVLDADGVAGYAVIYPRGDHLHLENVAVDPGRQGQGIGRRLLDFVEHEARRRGLAAVELYTNIHMTENQRLYPALGYVETGRRTEDGFARVFYRKAV